MKMRPLILSLVVLCLSVSAAYSQNYSGQSYNGRSFDDRRPSAQRNNQDQADLAREIRSRTYRDRYARPRRDGSTVQLPTFSFFSTTTTVSVPDGGTTFMGGVKRLSEGSTERGVPGLGKVPGLNRLFKNRGIGREVSARNVAVTARIINFEEEEEKQVGRVLAQRRLQGIDNSYAGNPVIDRRADFLSRNVARRVDVPVPEKPVSRTPSVEEIRQSNALAQQKRNTEAIEFFEKGQEAESAGKLGAAKIYFRMASRRAKGEFRQEALARLASLSDTRAAEKLATDD